MKDYIIDGHADTILNFFNKENYVFDKINPDSHIDLPRLKEADIAIETFALCVEDEYIKKSPIKRTIQLMDRLIYLNNKYNELVLIKSYKDIDEILNKNKIGAIMAIEGAYGVFDLSALRIFYQLGLRLITLTWNYSNHLATGIGEDKGNKGITEMGKSFIAEMNRLGIIIDVSHISPGSFWDVIKYSKKPIVASHSNVKNICNHPRNLNDDQIIAIANSGGIIGINFYPKFLSNSTRADIFDIIKHINYIKELVGIEYIGFGTDYDGIDYTPEGMEDISSMKNLKKILLENNFKMSEINKLFHGNWLRVFKEVFDD